MIRNVDFASLTLLDALDLAVLIEEEAKERYEELADQMALHNTPEAERFFRYMAINEAKHGSELWSRRVSLFGDAPKRVSRALLWDVEAPDYDAARAFMSPLKAMFVALHCEEKAESFFAEALPRIEEPEVKALFESLRAEEVEHQQLVMREIARLPPETNADEEAFVDEPNKQ